MIKATPNRVYNAITNRIAAWWGTPYLYTRLAKGIILEPRLGGRFSEVWGTGQGRLWGTVTQIKKNEWIEITGDLGMKGAVQGTICFALEAKEDSTPMLRRILAELDKYGSVPELVRQLNLNTNLEERNR